MYQVWESSIFEGEKKLDFGFLSKEEGNDFINEFNRGKDYDEGDTILYLVEVKGE